MKYSSILTILSFGTLLASQSGAKVMIAGWDFAQYAGANFNIVSSSPVFVNTLSANYSDYDPTAGAGIESAAFGTMYWDGSFGSTNGNPNPVAEAAPFSGSLTNNTDPGILAISFDAHTVLDAEGFAYSNFLSFEVRDTFGGGNGDLVFAATPTIAHTDWEIRFSATLNGVGNATVDILFSADGTTYNPVGTATITSIDNFFSYSVAGQASTTGFFKLDFSSIDTTGNPVIDNVSIHGTTTLLAPKPAISNSITGVSMTIVSDSEVGFDYLLQKSSGLSGWSDVETKTGTGSDLSFIQSGSTPGNDVFYRVSSSPVAP